MTTGPAALVTTPPAKPAPQDPRFDRTPMVRLALSIVLPAEGGRPGKLTIRETSIGARVTVLEAGGGIEKSVDLNVRELRVLAEHANRVARTVARRPEWKP